MTRKEIIARQRFLDAENKKAAPQMTLVPESEWPPSAPHTVTQVWRSSRFLAQLHRVDGLTGIRRLSICRTMINEKGDWRDDITWLELQQIKSECGFGHLDAVEVFPPDCDVVNVANMRHLFILDSLLDFVWRK